VFRSLMARVGRWRALPAVVLAVASVAVVAVQVPNHQPFSVYDEYVYFDYLTKVPTQGFVHTGEETGPEARAEFACRGVVTYTGPVANCPLFDVGDDTLVPYTGHTGADIYTPAYFAVTWVLAQPFTWFGIGLLDAGRLVGMVWLGAGILVLYALMRRLGVPRLLATGLGLGVIATPTIHWANTYVSTDAPALLAASGALLLAVDIWRGRRSPWWLVIYAAVVVAFKVQFIIPVAAAGLAIVVMSFLRWRRVRTRSLAGTLIRDRPTQAVLVTAVAGVAVQVAWLAFRARFAVPTPPSSTFIPSEPLTPVSVVENVFFFLRYVGLDQQGMNVGALGTLFGFLLTLATTTFLVIMITRRIKGDDEETALAWGLGVMSLAMGPVLLFLVYLSSHQIIGLPVRYGIVLLGGFVAGVGVLFAKLRWLGPVVTVLGAAAVVGALFVS
jgi:hypothetical protein